ncbi:hypothetical protein Cgig2_028643 [Carnegiea gigantea]|uniref:Uncharacterized protein n=1 Tax=Carnegiea gigantea TaxID=171969 RepID=A0A9Q1JXB1_9CARY|nr:hypothetical protein Cgig2_028643 [Carnegiea gigantea]
MPLRMLNNLNSHVLLMLDDDAKVAGEFNRSLTCATIGRVEERIWTGPLTGICDACDARSSVCWGNFSGKRANKIQAIWIIDAVVPRTSVSYILGQQATSANVSDEDDRALVSSGIVIQIGVIQVNLNILVEIVHNQMGMYCIKPHRVVDGWGLGGSGRGGWSCWAGCSLAGCCVCVSVTGALSTAVGESNEGRPGAETAEWQNVV